ncbi:MULTISPECIES: hypothetical protein [Pseudanabaena]|uniref:Uncharacterized protein n=2 Tax=Pseudanabaena TaxID=1152 RepID=L8MUF2_9CYAN|nr:MULTISPECIES: hypothetical protein [Pseudanabaena]ELS31597.1 hypothetical protein Pse7429DRAFT_3000 [Pseudanabaena biceps PCC 7429]MDG3496143.1 hypothetical protein [Pseudanabaena catenata USMAC16]
MVAKRDLSPHFSPQVPKQTPRSQGQYGRNDVVSIHSRSNHSATSGASSPSVQNGANSYSEAVAQNVQRKKEQFCRAKATESIIVIAVNVALSLAAIAAITKLLPYQSSQKDRLDEITTEVNSVEQRVNGMRDKLPQTLNSGKSQEMLLRKQGWIKNNQMTIKLLDPSEVATPNTDGMMPTTTTAQKPNQQRP